jgi:transposase
MFARYLPGACWWRFALGRCLWLQIVAEHDPHSFEVLPRGWVVERTFGWISKHRRTTRDY